VGGRAFDTTALGEPAETSVELGASMFIGDNRLVRRGAFRRAGPSRATPLPWHLPATCTPPPRTVAQLSEAAASLGLKASCRADEASRLGATRLAVLGKNRSLGFVEGRSPLTTLGTMAARYGLRAGARVRGVAAEFIRNFSRMYEAVLRDGPAARTPRALLGAADMQGWPHSSCVVAKHLELTARPTSQARS
jgi:hypothetical protein